MLSQDDKYLTKPKARTIIITSEYGAAEQECLWRRIISGGKNFLKKDKEGDYVPEDNGTPGWLGAG